jgi:hypothetical protein
MPFSLTIFNFLRHSKQVDFDWFAVFGKPIDFEGFNMVEFDHVGKNALLFSLIGKKGQCRSMFFEK